MKLCPQCAFIYEDSQGCCDMDGQELVHDPASGVVNQTAPPKPITSLPPRSRVRQFSVLFVGAVVLTALLFVIYFGQRQQSRTSYAAAIPIQSLPAANAANPYPSPVDSSNGATDASLPVESPDPSFPPVATAATSTDALTAKAPSTDATVASAHAATNSLAPNQSAPVIVRLTNGASIKADDAGETRNRVWYRQGGMVTVLKRSQVRAIERRRSSSPRSAIPANTSTVDAAAKNPLRIRRLEPATPKRPSRVTSFLKKTGQILSKPFKR